MNLPALTYGRCCFQLTEIEEQLKKEDEQEAEKPALVSERVQQTRALLEHLQQLVGGLN